MKLFLARIVFLISITAFAPFASGQTLYWAGGIKLSSTALEIAGAGNGDFNTAVNWSTVPPNTFMTGGTSGVPNINTVAVIQADLNNGTVFYTSQNSAFISLLTAQPVVINQTSLGNAVGGLLVSNFGFFGQGSGIVNFNNNTAQPFTVNGTNATGGDFVVDGGVTLNYTGGAFNVTKGTIVIGDDATFTPSANNTLGGAGTFNIVSGSFNFDTTAANPTQMIVGSSQSSNAFTSSNGTVTQGSISSASVVTTGSSLTIGSDAGVGAWNVTNGSVLQTGTQGTSYLIALGSNGAPGVTPTTTTTSSTGTLTISGASTFNLGFSTSTQTVDLQLGTVTPGASFGTVGGTGKIVQNGVGSNVNLSGTHTTVEVGDLGGGTGIYQLSAGNLNIGTNATDSVAFTLGAAPGSTGTLTQTGGNLTVGNSGVANGTTFVVGGAGTGVYTMSGGTATFFNALNLGFNGTVNLNGGTLQIAVDKIIGNGALNFNSGTLKLTAATVANPVFNYNFGGTFTGGTATIDASTAGLTTFNFTNPLTGSGGITLIGNGNTSFNFASVTQGAVAANTYSGSTGIIGGTLNATGDDFANANPFSTLTIGTTGSTGTLNLSFGTIANPDLILPQNISGNGTLNVNFEVANGTLTLSNTTNSLSTVNIVLGANTGPNASATPGTLQLFSGSFGTISEGTAGNNVIIGAAAGSGSVTFGNATYTGTTTIFQNYALSTASLSGDVSNAGFLNVTGASGITGNVTSNSGQLSTTTVTGNVTNSGLMVVSGAAGIVGNVTSNSGQLSTSSVTGNVTNSGLFIASASANTVGGNLINTGTIMTTAPLTAVANTPNFTVGGNLTLDPGGALVVRVSGPVSDQFAVAGTADLDNGKILVQVLTGGKIGATSYSIVTGSSVTDAGLTLSPNTALFSFALANNGTSENLIVTQAPMADFAQTPNQKAVARVLDGSTSPLFSFFGSIPLGAGASTIPGALEQLTPESLQYARMIAFENSTFLAQRTNGWLADLRSGYAGLDSSAISLANPGFESGLGRSLGSLLASSAPSYHQSAPNGVNYYPGGSSDTSSPSSAPASTPTWDSSTQVISDSPNPYMANQNPSAPGAPAMSEFISGDAVLADLNQNQSAANAPSSKASYTSGDAAAGVSFRMTSHLAAGVLFDYTHTDAKTDSSGSKTTVDSYSPGLFATYFDHGFYVNGLAAFGYNDYSNRRKIGFLGDTASSSPSGQQYVGNLDFGYDFHPAKQWIVGPTLGVTYTHLDIDSFSETGSPEADLSVDSQSADSLRSRLGGHVIFQTYTGDVLLQPNLTAMWQHEYLDNGSGITSNFNDLSSSSFTIQTAAPSRDSALIGCGLTATLSNSMAVYLNYLADVGASDYFAQSVVGGFKARF